MPQIMDTPGVPSHVKPNVEALRQAMLANRDMSVDDNLLELAPKGRAVRGRVRNIKPRTVSLAPGEDTDARGGPQRPKVRDVGGGEVEIRGFHATRDPDDWVPKRGLHIGTQRAAQHRMINAASSMGIRDEYDIDPHGLYEVTVRVPRDSVEGLQRGVPDLDANDLASAMRGEGVSDSFARNWPERTARATSGRTRVVGYQNEYEDPGSRSWIINEPSSITSVNRLYDAGSRAVGWTGLANMLSGFLGGPTLQFPSDWIIQELMRTNSRSPWNPENQMGYTVPA